MMRVEMIEVSVVDCSLMCISNVIWVERSSVLIFVPNKQYTNFYHKCKLAKLLHQLYIHCVYIYPLKWCARTASHTYYSNRKSSKELNTFILYYGLARKLKDSLHIEYESECY